MADPRPDDVIGDDPIATDNSPRSEDGEQEISQDSEDDFSEGGED